MTTSGSLFQTPKILADKNYEIIGILGEGSKGKTYKAKQLNTGLEVAIKSLKLSKDEDAKGYEMFRQEAEVLKKITVKGVPKYYDSIFPENGEETCYIIQEYVDMPSLLDLIYQNGTISDVEILMIMEKVTRTLQALETLYSPPIIHRDIKPSNILCRAGNGVNDVDYEVYLIDFGAVANPRKTSINSGVAGTCGYMAPEQMLGELTIQSDFYSLGATALHAITGEMPVTMESNVFELNVDKILDEKGHFLFPNKAIYTKQLLKILLSADIDKRPVDAAQLYQMIQRVKAGQSPYLPKAMSLPVYSPKALSWSERFHNRLFAKQEDLDMDWISGPGLVRGLRYLTVRNARGDSWQEPALEYTFEAKGRLWCGVWSIQNMLCDYNQELSFANLSFPISCTVEFSPDDPRMNRVIDVIFNGTELKFRAN